MTNRGNELILRKARQSANRQFRELFFKSASVDKLLCYPISRRLLIEFLTKQNLRIIKLRQRHGN